MSLSGPIQNQAKAGDANPAATACLPQDLLASILVRLPAGDLRRLRRVCKEWREIISSHAFIDDHMVHGPRTQTHTIVFFPGQPYSDDGNGFLFDDQWRLRATFSAPRFDDMIGQCHGLLCFHQCHLNHAIHIVEPFTGESLALPLPPRTEWWRDHTAYCFGFDPSSRRYKIFYRCQSHSVTKQDLYVYTIGGGDKWRRVQVAGETVTGLYYGDPVFADGSVYWTVCRVTGRAAWLARFDLATEQVTSQVPIPFRMPLGVMADSDARVRVMTMTLPHWRQLAWPHPLQRDQLLLQDYYDGGLYAHAIAPATNDLGGGELLVGAMVEDWPASSTTTSGTTRGLFVPVQVNREEVFVARRTGHQNSRARVFCYAPPVSPAPLAHFFGNL